MRATLIVTRDPIRPTAHREVKQIGRPRRLRALAPRTGQAVICLVNGSPVMRAGWNRKVRDGDVVAFFIAPRGGGGGSNPMRMVLTLAVMAFAAWAAPVLAGAMGISGTIGTGLVQAAIGIAGSVLVNALVPPPKPPSAVSMASISASPTYSLSAQGNQARLEAPIPVIYGRHLVYPDFGAMPYTEYAGDEQYLYQLLVIGQGEYDIETIRIEDTPISSFAEISIEVVPPGGSVTLFPTNVITSAEVSGQEALTGTTLGPFVVCPAGTQADTIGIDVVCPKGLYYANDSGGLSSVSVSWKVELQAIDDVGAPLGDWVIAGTESISAATTTPQRRSNRYSVTPGRYQARLTRLDTKQTDSRYGHDLLWGAARAYIPGSQSYGAITVVAMRMRATNSLSAQASRRVNMIVTRKLPAWDPATGWSATAATRSIAWAFADAARAQYGGRFPDARVALQSLHDLDAVWASRGDYFDGVFDSPEAVWDVLETIARAGRALRFMQGGVVQIARDQPSTLPVAMFTMRNIVRGSFRLDYVLPTEETCDAVEVTYFDDQVWAWRPVMASLPGSAAANPAKVKLRGVTNRAHAWREGMYMAACDRYRRRFPSFSTEMEGFIPTLLDPVAISHDMPRWGQSGEVVGWNASTLTLTLSEPLDWSAGGAHYIAWRKRNGTREGPHAVTAGADAYHAVLAALPDFAPDVGSDRERSHYQFGPSSAQSVTARVMAMKPASMERVDLAFVVESDAVHTADTGAAPGATAWQLPNRYTEPVVAGLVARSMPDAPDRMILSWKPAAGGEYYLVEQSEDGEHWTRSGEPRTNNYTATALYGPRTIIRVAAVGVTKGPWVEVSYGQSASYAWTNDADPAWTNDADPAWSY